MTRTRLTCALGLALLAAGCPAEKPATPPAPPAGDTNLGAPEAGSSAKKGTPVAPPAAPAEKPADPTPPPATPATDAAAPAETKPN